MPIYEYWCAECQQRFEELVSSADTRVACPQCRGHRVDRQMSVFSTPSGSWTDCGKPAAPERPCVRAGGCVCH